MFLGLLDPDLLVGGMDSDPYYQAKKSKENLDSYWFVTSF